jgi:hypothetical protein
MALENYFFRLTLQLLLVMVVIESRFGGDPAGRLLAKTTKLTALLPVAEGLKCLEFYLQFSIRREVACY